MFGEGGIYQCLLEYFPLLVLGMESQLYAVLTIRGQRFTAEFRYRAAASRGDPCQRDTPAAYVTETETHRPGRVIGVQGINREMAGVETDMFLRLRHQLRMHDSLHILHRHQLPFLRLQGGRKSHAPQEYKYRQPRRFHSAFMFSPGYIQPLSPAFLRTVTVTVCDCAPALTVAAVLPSTSPSIVSIVPSTCALAML